MTLYTPWGIDEPTKLAKARCVLTSSDKTYKNERCDWNFCTACHFKDNPVFQLRGFCPDEERIDTKYIILKKFISVNNTYKFLGLGGLSNLILENELEWKLFHVESNQTLAYLNRISNQNDLGTLKSFPFGLRDWIVFEHCSLKMDTPINLKLLFSRVN